MAGNGQTKDEMNDSLLTPPLSTSETTPSTIYNGKTTVTTAGTRVALASSTVVLAVTISASRLNAGTIYIGNSTVTASNGFALSAGATVSLAISNLATVYVDSSANGDSVTYLAVA